MNNIVLSERLRGVDLAWCPNCRDARGAITKIKEAAKTYEMPRPEVYVFSTRGITWDNELGDGVRRIREFAPIQSIFPEMNGVRLRPGSHDGCAIECILGDEIVILADVAWDEFAMRVLGFGEIKTKTVYVSGKCEQTELEYTVAITEMLAGRMGTEILLRDFPEGRINRDGFDMHRAFFWESCGIPRLKWEKPELLDLAEGVYLVNP